MDQQPQWIEGLLAALNGRRKPIPAPKFDGTSDVRKFLQTFAEVAEQNQWDDEERNLHLKLALQGTAADCVQGDTTEQIAESLLTQKSNLHPKRMNKISMYVGCQYHYVSISTLYVW